MTFKTELMPMVGNLTEQKELVVEVSKGIPLKPEQYERILNAKIWTNMQFLYNKNDS